MLLTQATKTSTNAAKSGATILMSHPTGNENVRQAALAFREAEMLGEFWTSVSWDEGTLINRLLPAGVRRALGRRSFPTPIRSQTRTVPLREMGRLLSKAIGFPLFSQHETGAWSIDQVARTLDRKVASRLRGLSGCDLVYAYEDSALESFRCAASKAIPRVYDLPIGYWRAAREIFVEEATREPDWACTLTGMRDSAAKLERKDQELMLASHVVVASSFTKETLSLASFNAPVDVIPYGAPAAICAEPKRSTGKLKVLFAGGLGQRKGLSYLLKAVEMLNDSVELTLLGRKTAPDCRPLESAVRKYRWLPSMSHQAVLEEMSRQDVLVFPSLFEGFGLVISEAMAQGTPVITTRHTAGPDLISDGEDGFIVPIRSAEAIAARLDLLAGDRERLLAMKHAARRKAESQRWETYRRCLVQAVARSATSEQVGAA